MTGEKTGDPVRISTGNVGLDAVLRGGLPPNRTYLLEGAPGSGKTTLALQFLLEGFRCSRSPPPMAGTLRASISLS